MVRCMSGLMQKPVLGYYSGRKLGAVSGFFIQPESHRLSGVLVKKHRWSAGNVFWICDICRDSSRLSVLTYTEEGEKRRKKEENGIGFPLCLGTSVMRNTRIQGQIADVWVNWPAGTVAWYEVSKGYLDDMRHGRAYARGYWVRTARDNWVFQCVQEV
jgi:uncharacterized protein YrrD